MVYRVAWARRATAACAAAVVFAAAPAAQARMMGVYDYPFVSPLAATVAATPPANQAQLASEAVIEEVGETRFVEVFPDRVVPEVFWYYRDGLPYGLFAQPDRRAPLLFLIGGTGAGYDSTKSRLLVRAFYLAGYHVVSLPSPTHSSFIVTASAESVPGLLEADAADLYRVINLIRDELADEIDIGEVYVGGYSLGGTHAAFVSRQDARDGRLRFRKALAINPPVSLFNSVGLLDGMLGRNLEKDPAAVSAVVDQIFAEMSTIYNPRQQIDYSDPNFIYRAYTLLEPAERELETLIGIAFRVTSNDMSFASDVMTNAGYVVPKDAKLTATTSLTDVFISGMGLNFQDYLEGVYVPHARRRFPGATRERLIAAASLRSIESYLRDEHRVVMVGTANDLILAPGEVAWLDDVFGERASIFPTGGHCGSMDQREFVAEMLRLLAE